MVPFFVDNQGVMQTMSFAFFVIMVLEMGDFYGSRHLTVHLFGRERLSK